jgi:hypothetical protein
VGEAGGNLAECSWLTCPARVAAKLKMGLKLDHSIERVRVGENVAGREWPQSDMLVSHCA